MPTELRRPERTFTIRQLCLEFKCTPRALRFYEDKGLLSPARQGLNRIYSYKDRADRYLRELSAAEAQRLRVASDAVKYSTLREQLRQGAFAQVELYVTR